MCGDVKPRNCTEVPPRQHASDRAFWQPPSLLPTKLFEMPLAGYLGYLPFALEVYLWKELWLREPELLENAS